MKVRTYQGSRKAERGYDLSVAHIQQALEVEGQRNGG